MTNRYTFILLLLVVVLGAMLRIYDLVNNPPGFYTDEASIGFNAYKILTEQKDEHGDFLPIFFKAFGEYKTPLAVYPVVPYIAIFGPNEFAVRLQGAIFGVANIVLMFFLGKILFSRNVGLLSAFVLAISPWHVHMSRFLIESHNAYIFFVSGGIIFFVLALRNNWQLRYLVLTSIFWALSLYTYFAVRVFTPLFLLGLLIIFKKEAFFLLKTKRKNFFKAFLIFLLISLPFLLHVFSGDGLARFQQVAFSGQGASGQSLILERTRLYLSHFDPRFVFLRGDSDFPGQIIVRHSVNGMGLFYKWQFLFFVFGAFSLMVFNRDVKTKQSSKILFLVLLLYPLGTLVSNAEIPFATRSVIGIVAYTILISYGIERFLRFVRKNFASIRDLSTMILIMILVFASAFYLERYIQLQRAYKNRAYGYAGFQYGAKQVIDYFVTNQNKYDSMLLGSGFDGANAYIDFFSLGKCLKCQVGFNESWQGEKRLVAVSAGDLGSFDSSGQTKVHTIYYPDSREAFYIFAR